MAPAPVSSGKRLLVVGTGMQAEEASYYFASVDGHTIDAHLLDPEYLREPSFQGRPVLDFAEAQRRFPPSTHAVVVAIGMLAMDARKRWFLAAQAAGYELPSHVHPKADVASNVRLGAGTVVKEFVSIAPFVQMGDNIILCPQACISHHCRLGSHGFYAPGALLSGAVEVGERCFIGAGAIVRDRVRIGEGCVIGAGALVMEDCAPAGVYRGERTRRTREL